MNAAELNARLDALLALPVENEWVEFKEALPCGEGMTKP